jgi:nucleotide-binding universal stress UspA family protein
MSFTKILAATDFSEHGELAAHQALYLARHTGAELVLAHGCELTAAQLESAERSFGQPELFEKLLRSAIGQAHKDLESARQRLSGQGAPVSQVLVDMPIHEGVCAAAAEIGAELVVVGAHGASGITRFVLGGVAEKFVRSCETSVLVSRSDAGSGGFRRIVVPVDFSPVSEKAIETAKAVAAKGAVIQLLHYWALPVYTGDAEGHFPIAELSVQLQRQSEVDLEALRARHASAEVDIAAETQQSSPRQAIRNYLEENDTDLVVMGSRGRKGFKRFLLGSVAEYTIRHAPCSVLVVHPDR